MLEIIFIFSISVSHQVTSYLSYWHLWNEDEVILILFLVAAAKSPYRRSCGIIPSGMQWSWSSQTNYAFGSKCRCWVSLFDWRLRCWWCDQSTWSPRSWHMKTLDLDVLTTEEVAGKYCEREWREQKENKSSPWKKNAFDSWKNELHWLRALPKAVVVYVTVTAIPMWACMANLDAAPPSVADMISLGINP